jgi:hypothetical protein
MTIRADLTLRTDWMLRMMHPLSCREFDTGEQFAGKGERFE